MGLEHLHVVLENVKRCGCHGKWYAGSKKLKAELLYNPAASLVDIYLKELKLESRSDICTAMFIAASFTKPRRRNNLNVHQ